jgi:hypothetical protein
VDVDVIRTIVDSEELVSAQLCTINCQGIAKIYLGTGMHWQCMCFDADGSTPKRSNSAAQLHSASSCISTSGNTGDISGRGVIMKRSLSPAITLPLLSLPHSSKSSWPTLAIPCLTPWALSSLDSFYHRCESIIICRLCRRQTHSIDYSALPLYRRISTTTIIGRTGCSSNST